MYHTSPGEWLGLQRVEFQFLPLPHCKAVAYSEMYGTCKLLLPGVKYILLTHHKDFSVQQCQKRLGILLGFIYILLDVVCVIFSYIKDFYRICH